MIFFSYLEPLPWGLSVLIIVLFFVVFTVCGMLIVRKLVNMKTLRAHHDVAGFIFANLGVLYAVLLGFTVVNVQQRFDGIKQITRVEAGYLAELYQDAELFSDESKQKIRSAIKKYILSVVHEEWVLMSYGLDSPATEQALKEVWRAYYNLDLSTEKEKIGFSIGLNRLNQLMSARLTRLLGAEESLGKEMWTLLILGAFVIMGFTWFFGLESTVLHMLMGSILAASTAFLLYLIYSLDTTYTGSINISPEALNKVLISLD